MIISNATMDLIDNLMNEGLEPCSFAPDWMNGIRCVSVRNLNPERFEEIRDTFPGATLDYKSGEFVVFWPDFDWEPGVQEYVDTLNDPSGRSVSQETNPAEQGDYKIASRVL